MAEIIRRMVWFAAIAGIISYATYIVAGTLVQADAAGSNEPVVIRDELRPGAHHLSGMVMVPSPCDQLSVKIEMIAPGTYAIIFTTWHEPSVACPDEEMPRHFRIPLAAPSAGITFTATLDGRNLSIMVIPEVVKARNDL